MIEKSHLLNQKNHAISNRISLILTYNSTFPDIKRAVNKHWDILKITRDFQQVFTEFPLVAFKRNRKLQDILGKKTIINNRKQLCQNINPNHYLKPCNSSLNNLCCTQVQSTNTFRSTVTQKALKVYNKLNCESKYLIYIMECVLCNKQYTSKSETTFNLRVSSHQKDLNKQNSLQADQHFRLPGHKFNKLKKLSLIRQLNDSNKDKELLKYRLKNVKTFRRSN